MRVIKDAKIDYGKLVGRIREYHMTQKELAQIIGMSEGHLSLKLNGAFSFKQSEILNICEALNIPCEDIGTYFFGEGVQKTEQRRETGTRL